MPSSWASRCALQATCAGSRADGFDHDYRTYAEILKRHVRYPRVDYAALKADRVTLDRAVAEFDAPAARGEPDWTREQRMAFWINAYNVFTLRVPGDRDASERAVLGAVVRFGPSRAAEIARAGKARIVYLSYDWSLNDIQR